jgi:class 3 adenylate cyclase
MPRRGYRFIGPVATTEENDAVSSRATGSAVCNPGSTQPVDAERRQITIMSCELIGMSRRAHSVDLDDLHEGLGAFHCCASETAARHDGLVVTRLGNTVIAFFGYPATLERDAEHAVRGA